MANAKVTKNYLADPAVCLGALVVQIPYANDLDLILRAKEQATTEM
jgi:hypothetical protein